MKRLRLSPLLFRRIHKWIGLILGLQFFLWALSGSMMALLDMKQVGGHDAAEIHAHPLPTPDRLIDPARIPGVRQASGLVLRDLAGSPVYEVRTEDGIRLFGAHDGHPIRIDAALAKAAASQMTEAPIRDVVALPKPNLEAREHSGPMWRINFADAANSSAYVSAETGRVLVMRGDTWRTWDFFWMLHNMDWTNPLRGREQATDVAFDRSVI
ncbi:PepSY domain-containing protein [Sphingobium sp. MK2]|uniref:PepSY domain-containing protein n=1 Tax=Sphingobium sp. MK2 TaxID=3116540 RepID=UPI0032E35D29